MKGQLEDAIKMLHFPKSVIFKPPVLIRENSDRTGEIIGAKVVSFFNKIGLFRSQKPLPAKLLAEAMLKSVKTLKNGEYVIEGQSISGFLHTEKIS